MSPDYLELEDLLVAAELFLGHAPEVRDYGLLESALARPRATVFGRDAYPTLDEKAAALLLSLVGNHALVDGNKRLGWFGVVTCYELNGRTVRLVGDSPFETIMAIARGELVDVPVLAAALRSWTTP
ncbi:type II toxin-antitoxin system death-on-curing family toxin [Pengzhenrongella sp.]|uniref:type II toxin-antitoxin system death-on-curing family toxin n=1 Tax=Pengzhenrongella sp. TaxID=2888820 RepID=UPI002F954509